MSSIGSTDWYEDQGRDAKNEFDPNGDHHGDPQCVDQLSRSWKG